MVRAIAARHERAVIVVAHVGDVRRTDTQASPENLVDRGRNGGSIDGIHVVFELGNNGAVGLVQAGEAGIQARRVVDEQDVAVTENPLHWLDRIEQVHLVAPRQAVLLHRLAIGDVEALRIDMKHRRRPVNGREINGLKPLATREGIALQAR